MYNVKFSLKFEKNLNKNRAIGSKVMSNKVLNL